MPRQPYSPYNHNTQCGHSHVTAVPVNTSTTIKLNILREQLEEQIKALEEKINLADGAFTKELTELKQNIVEINSELDEVEALNNSLEQRLSLIEVEVEDVQTQVEGIYLDGGEITF